jgi:hypothetical protein
MSASGFVTTPMTFVLVHEIKSGETSGVKTFGVGNGRVWNVSHVELRGLIASTQAHARESSEKSVTLNIPMNKYSKEENTRAKVNTNRIQPSHDEYPQTRTSGIRKGKRGR